MSSTKYLTKYANIRTDLHLHTNFSDGAFTPTEVVQLSFEKGIKVVAVTDHDTVAGLKEAAEAADKLGLELLTGVELSTIERGKEIHILGYQIDPLNSFLLDSLQILAEARDLRARKIVTKLNDLGHQVTMQDVIAQAGSAIIGRPHIALAMMEQGITKSINEAFAKFLSPGGLAYVPRYRLKPQEAIELIVKAGGYPVLAHPGIDFPAKLLPVFVDFGLAGIEVHHPDNSPQIKDYYQRRANEAGLLITGGSDFHGHDRKDFIELGQMPTAATTLAELLQQRKT